MAKRIESNEIVQPDILGDLRKSITLTEGKADALVITLNLVNETLSDIKKNASTIKGGLVNLGKTNTKDLDARTKAQRTANQLAKDAIELERMQQKLSQDIINTRTQTERLKQAELRTQKALNAEKKKELTSYQLESRALNEMRNRYKDLAVQREKGIKLTRDERNEMRSLLTQINQTDTSLKKIDASVGQNQRNVGNYTQAVSGLRNGLAQLGVSFGVFQALKFAGNEIINFENAVASFRTIVSDLNDKDFEKYKDQIKSVASETKRSNTEIAESFEVIAGLNSEFAKTEKGLGDVSEAVSTLSDASRDDLATSASNLVGIMNQFDLSASEANRTINVLAAGQAVGASSITQSAEAYKNFGAVAKGANITLEQSQALIQVLGKNSIFGAEAGTKLRGVTLQLQKAQLGYASGQFNINDALEEFNAKMAKKTTASAKDAYATKVFGAENITAGKIVSNNIELFNQYTKSVTGTNEAQKASEINTNTLSKRWEQLKNAISNTITSNSSANSGMNVLKGTLKLLADNLDTVISFIGKGITAWITYKTVMMALRLTDQIKNFRDLGSGIKNATNNLTDAQRSAKGFGQAISGIGWTAIITALVEVAKAWYDVASGANQARFRVEQFNKATSSGTEQATTWLEKLQAKEKKALQAIEDRLSKRQISEKEAIRLRQEAIGQTQKIITQEKTRLQAEKALLQVQLGSARARRDRVKESLNPGFIGNTIAEAGELNKAEKAVTDLLALEKRNTAEIIVLNKALEGSSDSMHDLNIEQNELITGTDKNTKAVKALNTELDKQNEYLSKQTELLRDLDEISFDFKIEDYDENIQLLKDKALETAKNTGNIELSEVNKAIYERAQVIEESITAREDFEINAIKERYRIEKEEARKSIEENRAELLSQQNLTADERAKIEANYQKQLEELDKDNLQRNGDMELEIQKVKKKSKRDLVKLEKDTMKEIGDIEKQSIENTEEFNREQEAKQLERSKEIDDAEKERLRKRYEDEKTFIELTTKFLEDQIDRRIAKLDEFTEASKKSQEDLRELANNGNIQAQQSIAREAQLQREAQAEKQRLERQKAWLQVVSSFLQNYNNKLAEGKKGTVALAEAVTEKAVLESIIKTIPAFKDGGVHKDGGLMLVNDAPGSSFREIIETPKGELYSPEGRNVLMNAPKGTKIHTQDQWADLQNDMRAKDAFRNANSLGGNTAGNSFDIAPLLKEVKGLKKAISDQPDRWAEFMAITEKSFALHFVSKKGGKTDRIIHQYRKNS